MHKKLAIKRPTMVSQSPAPNMQAPEMNTGASSKVGKLVSSTPQKSTDGALPRCPWSSHEDAATLQQQSTFHSMHTFPSAPRSPITIGTMNSSLLAKPILQTPDIKMLVGGQQDFTTPEPPLQPTHFHFETPLNQDLKDSFCSPEMFDYFLNDHTESSHPHAESTMDICADEIMYLPGMDESTNNKHHLETHGGDSLLDYFGVSPVGPKPEEPSVSEVCDECRVPLVDEYKAFLKGIPASKIKFIASTSFDHGRESYNMIAACSSDPSTTKPVIAHLIRGKMSSTKLHGFILHLWKDLHFFNERDFIVLSKRSESMTYEIQHTLSLDLWISDKITLICTPINAYNKLHPMASVFKLLRKRIQREIKLGPQLPMGEVNSHYHEIIAALASISHAEVQSAYNHCGYY